ncbi:MAG: class I SAM-dependent methyltransferase [Oligoflexia bacterium]|nr:class I SAM-dependent methyltransferase [Oligoflexia bacterium]
MNYYEDGTRYNLDYGERTEDISFYVNLCGQVKGSVLELGCGTGRISMPLARNGIRLIAVDNAPAMLETAAEKARADNLEIEFIKRDFTGHFDLKRQFDMIIMTFNSFQHVYTNKEAEVLFDNVKKHLVPGGVFVFDIINPVLADLGRGPDSVYVYDVYYVAIDPATKQMIRLKPEMAKSFPIPKRTIIVEDVVDYNDATQIATFTLYYSIDKKEKFTSTLTQRFYFPQELDALVTCNGFNIIDKYGDYNLAKFTKGSPSQIVVAEKV